MDNSPSTRRVTSTLGTVTLVTAAVLSLGAASRGGPWAAASTGLLGPTAAAAPQAVHDSSSYSLIPWPAHLIPGEGWFHLDRGTRVVLAAGVPSEVRDAAEAWAALVRLPSHLPLPVVDAGEQGVGAGAQRNAIRLMLLPEGSTEEEGYRLSVTSSGVTIGASTSTGLFYGIQTLRQLLPVEVEIRATEAWRIPAVEIEDAPRFTYRGLHLDVGRHFFPVEVIKGLLDQMAFYKLNTFHWHLTEDQGWRLEILGYPRLTEVGGCRAETMVEKNFDPYVGDGIPYCGHYTQEEAREIVEYARRRFITVIPEIEMPGHSLAALAAYPELACTPGPFEVATTWGVFEDIYCPSETTFTFLKDVLGEVMEIFPSELIHVGGDEAPKRRWRESPLAQEVIRREGLADEDELQSWFIRRISHFLSAHGRRLIGWDEILEGGLAPDATVMSWRGMAGGIEAARQGNDVVMTPTSHLYFDYYQGDPEGEPLAFGGLTTLRTVYDFEPIPNVLTPEEADHIVGAQANVWTEYMRTSEQVEYMVFPRLLALSEVVWSSGKSRDWRRFSEHLGPHLERLSHLGVRYRPPDVQGLMPEMLALGSEATIPLRAPFRGAEIRYTVDGSEPTEGSPRYHGPLTLSMEDGEPVTLRARVVAPDGRLGPVAEARVTRTRLRPALPPPAPAPEPGLELAYYEGRFLSVEELREDTPVRTGTTTRLTLQGDERPEYFGLSFSGYLQVPADGVYTFSLTSDDGSRLRIGGELVVDHDGLHGMTERLGVVALEAGVHPFELLYFQAGGGAGLEVRWGLQGEELREISGELLVRPAPEG